MMTINNVTTKKNLDAFIALTMSKGEKLGLKKSQLDDLYTNAINVFLFNDLEKAPEIDDRVVDFFWCVLNPLYYQNWKGVSRMKIYKTKLYRVDYKGTHGGGVDHIRGRIILERYPWIVSAAANGEIELTKVN